MQGRAKAAPLLRRKAPAVPDIDSTADLELDVLQDVDNHAEVVVPDADRRDLSVWPHLYPEAAREAMFPRAVAAPAVETVDAQALAEHSRLHQRWAAVKIGITCG